MKKMPRILVIGDIMLDIYRYGDVDRISPEAPVPVVHIHKSTKSLGGAGNTFSNLFQLNSTNCMIVSIVGRDRYGLVDIPDIFLESFPNSCRCTLEVSEICTVIKERIIARSQQVCRLDWETVNPVLSEPTLMRLKTALIPELSKADVVVISDYAKGIICPEIINLIEERKKIKKFITILDPHPKNTSIYSGIDYATPNKSEFDQIGFSAFWGMGCKAIIRTEGEGGMSAFVQNGDDFHFDTEAKKIFDVSGAGDTVIAVLAHMLAFKFSLLDAVIVANQCAGVVVSKPGTTPIQRHEFDKILRRIK